MSLVKCAVLVTNPGMGRDGQGHEFATLDGLRGIAALAIVTRHAIGLFGFDPAGPVASGPFPESYLAVDFFFVLSGFVLAHAYGERLQLGSIGPLKFMTIRAVRLYPLYVAALVLAFPIALKNPATFGLTKADLILDFVLALFFLPWPGEIFFPLNVPTWSLHFEMIANLVYSFIARYLTVAKLIALVIVAGVALIVAVEQRWFGFGSDSSGIMNSGFRKGQYLAGTSRVFYSFFCGVLAYRLHKTVRPKFTLNPIMAIIILGLILLTSLPSPVRIWFELGSVIAVFPCLVFFGADRNPSSAISCMFSVMGRASYAIYVFQIPAYNMFYGTAQHLTHGQIIFEWPIGILFMVVLASFAVWADSRYDNPVRKKLYRWLRA